MERYIESSQNIYFWFLFWFSHPAGKKCVSLYPFESKEHLIEKNWRELVWKKFTATPTLFVAIILRLEERVKQSLHRLFNILTTTIPDKILGRR